MKIKDGCQALVNAGLIAHDESCCRVCSARESRGTKVVDKKGHEFRICCDTIKRLSRENLFVRDDWGLVKRHGKYMYIDAIVHTNMLCPFE